MPQHVIGFFVYVSSCCMIRLNPWFVAAAFHVDAQVRVQTQGVRLMLAGNPYLITKLFPTVLDRTTNKSLPLSTVSVVVRLHFGWWLRLGRAAAKTSA
jgi:hypothetical protein